MFYAMVFHRDPYNPEMSTVRAKRAAPYKSLDKAIKAIEKDGHQGYIKRLGIGKPIWNNVQ